MKKTYKRDLQKMLVKETYKRDPSNTDLERNLRKNYPVRQSCTWKETYKRDLQKRPVKETYTKRPFKNIPREKFELGLPCASKETGACEKRPITETHKRDPSNTYLERNLKKDCSHNLEGSPYHVPPLLPHA